jgi:hypothetical protein
MPSANPTHHHRSRICTLLLATALTISSTPTASATPAPQADLAVKLGAVGAVLLAGARYTVSITNNGPDPLTSATVIVRVDRRAYTTAPEPSCPFDPKTTTFTCSFGSLPAGTTASLNPFVYFHVTSQRATLEATATRTASTPTDPNSNNDTDPATCWYERPQPGQTWPPPTTCTLN